MLINPNTMEVAHQKWAIDLAMISGRATYQHDAITQGVTRVIPCSQSSKVSGALRVEIGNGTFTVVSSNEEDNGLVYCEVKI